MQHFITYINLSKIVLNEIESKRFKFRNFIIVSKDED